jgi:predicted dehydrogenase
VAELRREVENHSSIAVVGYQLRFHPCLQRLHALIQENRFGQLLSARAEIGEYLPGWHTYEDYRQMYASRQDLGGGVILSQIHEMDYLCWFFGLPRRVVALGGHFSSLEVDVEDTAEILMDFNLGGRSLPVSLHVDYLQRPARRFCEILAERGRLRADLAALQVEAFDGMGKLVETANFQGFQRNRMFMDELNAFFSALKGQPTPLVTLGAAVSSLRMALAARESIATGAVVELKG